MSAEQEVEICEKCHRARAEVTHHILPTSCGGSSASWNVAKLCNACHRKKHAWLNKNGLRTECPITGRNALATYYGRTKKKKENVIPLEKYNFTDFEANLREVIQKAQEAKS